MHSKGSGADEPHSGMGRYGLWRMSKIVSKPTNTEILASRLASKSNAIPIINLPMFDP